MSLSHGIIVYAAAYPAYLEGTPVLMLYIIEFLIKCTTMTEKTSIEKSCY